MADFTDVVSSLMLDAAKSSTTDRQQAERAVRRTIQAINRAMDNWVIASRDSSIAVAANATTVTLGATVHRVKDLGRYDSATQRIYPIYTEISERQFHENYSGSPSLPSISPTEINEWFFVDDTTAGVRKVRLVFPPNTSFTMMVTFYEKLTETNVDRLDDADLLYNGSVGRMPGWFPTVSLAHFRFYETGLDEMRSKRRSTKRTISEYMNPGVHAHNMLTAYLTQ